MRKKKIVIALGHDALGTTLPEQKRATKRTAKAVVDFIRDDYQVVISHSNGPQVGMIHTAMSEFCRIYPEYTPTPMSVCSAMSQGYIGYDLQNAIRTELLNRGIYKPVSTILTQVMVDPYDEAFYHPTKIIGRVMTEEEAETEEKKGNHVIKTKEGFRRIVAAPKPVDIVEIDAVRALLEADQVVIACGGGGIPVLTQEHKLKGASAVIEKDLAAGKLADLGMADPKSRKKGYQRLQDAIDHSKKDILRYAESLNAVKRKLKDFGQADKASLIGRFQNYADRPYVVRYGATAVLTSSKFIAKDMVNVVAKDHGGENLELMIIHNQNLKDLINELYRRAAKC